MFKAPLEPVKEDSVEYWLFNENLRSENEEFVSEFQSTVSKIVGDYIWHKDPFNLHLPLSAQEELSPHLYGITFYGDNIEDEWFIVYVIMDLTKKFSGTIAQVRDNDGEFLLIEAANALPSWATPETTENRVFIVNGEVHIIPPELENIDENISVRDALSYINSSSNLTRANNDVQIAIKKKIEGYPNRIRDSLHRACVRLPLKYAAILTLKPSLIAPVVNSYCNRDSLESNICKRMVIENTVDCSVKFTKCLYAMLIHSHLLHKASWNLPPKSSADYKKCMLGVKLSCGFEILLAQADDIFSGKQWKSFLECLKNKGYFKENLEGSREYVKLYDSAKNFFLSNECTNINGHIGNTIKATENEPSFKHACEELLKEKEIVEDSDDWLNINPEELESIMSERYGGVKKKLGKDDIISPQTITNELSSFLKQTSDLEGVEIDRDVESKIDFDFENFTSYVTDILDSLEKQNGSDSDLDIYEGSDLEDEEDIDAKQYQKAMEEELSNSTMSQSFIKTTGNTDLTLNLYSNLVQSMKEEKGGSGPSSNMLSSIGVGKTTVLPLDSDDDDE